MFCEYGKPVEIGGLKSLPGDLIHGDRHGVHTIPLSIAAEIPEMAAEILSEERELIQFCRARDFHCEGWTGSCKSFPETDLRCLSQVRAAIRWICW
jgi:hypothetical protein